MAEEELLDTIEQIRKAKFPDLPADLVKQIVLIEKDFTEDRHEAYKLIGEVIDSHLPPRKGRGNRCSRFGV
jgi:hypothetical protein